MTEGRLESAVRPTGPYALGPTLSPMRRGPGDPCTRVEPSGAWWRATRTPAGPASLRIEPRPGDGDIRLTAWGAGAGWALEAAPDLLGLRDEAASFDPPPGPVRSLHHRLPGLRITRSRAVFEAIVPSIVEQKVAGRSARRSLRELVAGLGEPAPGPALLTLPPAPGRVAALASWDYHQVGIEMRRAGTLREAARRAAWLERLADLPPAEGTRRMQALPGVGPWTAAEVAVVALGDADAVSVGDFHLPHAVSWLLTGEPRGDDDRMLELLEPYRGHRGRVLRLIVEAGVVAPRFGPRQPLASIRRI